MTRWLLAISTAVTLFACAEPLPTPPPPAGQPCSTYVDCAPGGPDQGQLCGALHACVAGVCESTPSLFVACSP